MKASYYFRKEIFVGIVIMLMKSSHPEILFNGDYAVWFKIIISEFWWCKIYSILIYIAYSSKWQLFFLKVLGYESRLYYATVVGIDFATAKPN